MTTPTRIPVCNLCGHPGAGHTDTTRQCPPFPAVSLSVLVTDEGVNYGDHAQDVVRAVEVNPDETVASMVRRLLGPRSSYDRTTRHLTIRLVEPRKEEQQEFYDSFVPPF